MLDVLKTRFQGLIIICEEKASHNYFTNVYGLSRSLYALVTLFSLIFNSTESLFSPLTYKKKEILIAFSNINLFHIFGYDGLIYSKIIAIVILIICVMGYFPRYFGVLQWWVSFSFLNACTIVEGGDQITNNVLLLLIPITLMDSRKNHWINTVSINNNLYKNFIAHVLFCMISIQISVLYLQAGVEKLYKVDEWVDGSAIYYWLNSNLFGMAEYLRPIFFPIINTPKLLFIINWSVIIFELLMAGAIFMEYQKRKKLIYYAVGFHFLIAFFFGLVTFFIAMTATVIIYLIPKDLQIQFLLKKKR
ncbi:hypothetical protein GNY06_03465 [Elizabethkingia argentiflava]|uniref:HTTM-like domain-containing protein n=2 Tax=Elizabethkingia argenteiflava TaxID=2681556 RepID=A0A845PQL4_9FLAO|nr:hypothetical protein [Elizabethkingia argenteiflava]